MSEVIEYKKIDKVPEKIFSTKVKTLKSILSLSAGSLLFRCNQNPEIQAVNDEHISLIHVIFKQKCNKKYNDKKTMMRLESLRITKMFKQDDEVNISLDDEYLYVYNSNIVAKHRINNSMDTIKFKMNTDDFIKLRVTFDDFLQFVRHADNDTILFYYDNNRRIVRVITYYDYTSDMEFIAEYAIRDIEFPKNFNNNTAPYFVIIDRDYLYLLLRAFKAINTEIMTIRMKHTYPLALETETDELIYKAYVAPKVYEYIEFI